MTQTDPETTVTISVYDDADHEGVVALFTRINRELAPEDMRERFEAYIAASLARELRRTYLDHAYRSRGIAERMLARAESRARDLGFTTMILSTAEIQSAALAFYRKHAYRLVRTERAEAMSTKTGGGGLTRFHFEKTL